MKRLTVRLWVTHGIFALVGFGVLSWAFSRANGGRGVELSVPRLLSLFVGAVVLDGVLIAGFYSSRNERVSRVRQEEP